MPTYIVFNAAGFFRKADFNSERLGTVPVDTTFVGTSQGDGFIRARIPSVSPDEGFLLEDGHAEELVVAPIPLHARDFGTFCALVTRAARDESTDRDYLLAVAYDQTKNLSEMADAEGKKVGPFRYSEEEWSARVADPRLAEERLQARDRFLWYRQPIVAAVAASDAVKQFKSTFQRLPKFKELYFFQLVGGDALNALRTPEKLCRDVLAGPAGSYAAVLKAGAQTVNEAMADLQQHLEKAYAEALKVIDLQPPDIRFFRAHENDPPWMVIAREEMDAGVSEDASLRNTTQIDAYFTEVGSPPAPTKPWCGAFVGYCVKKCGDAGLAAKVTADSVGVSFWSGWGDPAPDPPPVGAIVILNGGGHVGFLAEPASATRVKVLGGNQGGGNVGPDRVGIVEFNRPDAKDFRWTNSVLLVPGAKAGPGDALFVDLAPRIMGKLTVDFPELEKVHLAAILGNLGHECAGFTQMQEIAPIGGGPGGLGWAQWTGTRRTEFEASLHGRPPNDFDANYEFLRGELKGSHQAAIPALRAAHDLRAAVVAFEDKFEKADARFKHYPSRERYAQIARSLI